MEGQQGEGGNSRSKWLLEHKPGVWLRELREVGQDLRMDWIWGMEEREEEKKPSCDLVQ